MFTSNLKPQTSNLDFAPVDPVPASSVLVVRQKNGRLEVFLTQRRQELRFLGGYTVFPGGRVDDEDFATAARISGLNRRCASRMLDLPAALAMAHWVAAFRELHEEIGLWLGAGPEPAGEHWHDHVRAQCTLPARRLTYVDHWITPPWVPMRFNTRFYVTVVDGEPAFRPHEREISRSWWATPADALAQVDAGDVQAIRPTLAILQTLAAFGTLGVMRQRWRGLGRRVPLGNDNTPPSRGT